MTKKETSILTDEDWEILLPSKQITLGKSSITMKPLGIEKFSLLTSKVTYAVNKIKKFGFSQKDMADPKKFDRVVATIVKEAPEIITLISGIPAVDVIRLPLAKNIELAAVAWELNMSDQETLAKNLTSVATMVQQLTGMMTPGATPTSETPPSS